jgi:hypothetical protein
MIKVGDEVICINNLYEYEYGNMMAELPCEVGDICKIKHVHHDEVSLFHDSWIFGINEDFFKYFITIGQWREQQIKTILDDNN